MEGFDLDWLHPVLVWCRNLPALLVQLAKVACIVYVCVCVCVCVCACACARVCVCVCGTATLLCICC